MNLFGEIKPQESIMYGASFEDFPTAMLLLFRCGLLPSLLCKAGAATIPARLRKEGCELAPLGARPSHTWQRVVWQPQTPAPLTAVSPSPSPSSPSPPALHLPLGRLTTVENWNALMWDCMVTNDCVRVKENFNLTAADGTSTWYWYGTYLDPSSDADVLSQMPKSAKVSGSPRPNALV